MGESSVTRQGLVIGPRELHKVQVREVIVSAGS